MPYETTPESQERYNGFSIKESPDSLPEDRIFFLNRDGWGLTARYTPDQPHSLNVVIDVEKYDSSIEESNHLLEEAKAAFHRFVSDDFGFWSQDESERIEDARRIEMERGGDPED